MQVEMTITLGNILTILGMVGAIFGAFYALDKRVEKKADKDIMTKELETIRLAIQKLSDKMDDNNKKIDEFRTQAERQGVAIQELEKQLLVLQTEHKERQCEKE